VLAAAARRIAGKAQFVGVDIQDTDSAARAYEDIRMTPNLLSVRQVSAKGAARETAFNPRWVRLEKTEDELYGVTRVALISRGIFLIVGAFLPPLYKSELAKRLAQALAAAKR